ncbi:MAG: glutamine--fructose-6-phosphate aminotransferase, partial [Clostridia bacterium]|nr:glutamine--fructose-6-phosphate aminotransferase [Clostridia bacterium]
MCGIIGYCGKDDAMRRVIDGLYALEYRGYDSAGAAAFSGGEVKIMKSAGRVARVDEMIKKAGGIRSNCAVGHTRWATHGAPSDINAHPHICGKTVVVH